MKIAIITLVAGIATYGTMHDSPDAARRWVQWQKELNPKYRFLVFQGDDGLSMKVSDFTRQ